MANRHIAAVVLLTVFLQSLSPPAQAQVLNFDEGFDPNRILEDDDIFDVNGMGYDRMVRFLKAKGSLADSMQMDIDGKMKPAVDIIWRVANSYKINPKYLLVLLQKEQSLVEGLNPTQRQFDWATGYGVCDSCRKDDPAIQDFKGFASQVEWAAKQHREKYLMQILGNGQTRAGKAAGKTMAIDGTTVTPVNNATAMLYSYTPHIHGNLNLWRIWRRWFSLAFPDGTLVRAKSSGKSYVIRLGQKRAFESRAVMESLVDSSKVVMVSDTELAAYPDGPAIRYPKFALLRDSKSKIWLLTGESKRYISNMKAFRKFDFNEDEVIDVDSDAELDEYPTGPAITEKTNFPQGVVMQNATDKSYWYVEGDTIRLLPEKTFITLYFRGRKIQSIPAKILSQYKVGETYRLHDGELVRGKNKPTVYVVEDGALLPIPSAAIFEGLGWKWKNVVTVSDSVLTAYKIGDAVGEQTLPNPVASTIETSTSPSTL